MKTATPDKVLDASAVAAILFEEKASKGIRQKIEGSTLAAPRLLRYEIANVAAKKMKSEGFPMTGLQQALDEFSRWEIEWYDVPSTKCMETAVANGLSAYDGAYLWLAEELGADLVTLDEKLKKTFRMAGKK